jgi:SAM-dependent methyltransferase
MHRVDYDQIAHLYDEPHRDHGVDPHLLALVERTGSVNAELRVLDVGCGTGKQLAANRRALPAIAMIGVDRFRGMLRVARRRCPEVTWVNGDGAALPLGSATCDYATSQFSYPHVRDVTGLVTEIHRVLRPGGRFAMTNIDPWAMLGWWVYRYFPEALTLDRRDFVPAEQFADTMAAAGFAAVTVARESRPWRDTRRGFLAFASERHRASQLMAIPDEAYAEGLRQLQTDAAEEPDAPQESEFVVVTITGDRPPGA